MKFMAEYLRGLTSLASNVRQVLYLGRCGSNGHNLVRIGKLKIFGIDLIFLLKMKILELSMKFG